MASARQAVKARQQQVTSVMPACVTRRKAARQRVLAPAVSPTLTPLLTLSHTFSLTHSHSNSLNLSLALYAQALLAPQKVAIDLSFPGLMSGSEVKSLTQQLAYSYSAAVNAQQQLHLHLLGGAGEIADALAKQLPGHAQWAVTQSAAPFQEFFAVRDMLASVGWLLRR